jgi:hypothetical protein
VLLKVNATATAPLPPLLMAPGTAQWPLRTRLCADDGTEEKRKENEQNCVFSSADATATLLIAPGTAQWPPRSRLCVDDGPKINREGAIIQTKQIKAC